MLMAWLTDIKCSYPLSTQIARLDDLRQETFLTTSNNEKSALSINDVRSMAFGKNVSMIRSRSKAVAASAEATQISQQGEAIMEKDQIHPGDRVFTPLVTCRYPQSDWNDAETFPAFLPMVNEQLLS